MVCMQALDCIFFFSGCKKGTRLLNGRAAGVGVLRIPLELEFGAEFLSKSSLDGFKNVGEDTKVGGVELVVLTALENTGADKTGVPAVHVSTDDVGGGVVTDHVDVLGQTLLAVQLLHPGGEDLVGVDVGGTLGLTVQGTLEIPSGNGLVVGFDGETDSAEVETWRALVLGRAEKIALGEVDGDVVLALLGAGEELAVVRVQQIGDELVVGHLIVGLGEVEDGIKLEVGKVAGASQLLVLLGENSAGRDGRVPGHNVLGVDHVLETVLLGHVTDLEALTTEDQHVIVVLGKSLHGGVGLNELVGGDGVAQNLGELRTASLLGLTTTVGQKDVGELDACVHISKPFHGLVIVYWCRSGNHTKLVVTVKNAESNLGLLNGLIAVCQHTVNVEGESHVLHLGDLVLLQGLKLSSENIPTKDTGSLPTRRARQAWRPGNGKRCAKGVTRATTVPHGRLETQVVHHSRGATDRAARSRNLNGTSVLIGDGLDARTAVRRQSTLGITGTRIPRGSFDAEVSIFKARHDEDEDRE